MTVLRALCIAFAMYSKIPVPRVEWDKKSLSWALCFFPLVGVVIGGVVAGWLWLANALVLGPMVRGAIALLIPIALSGGIHMDGFCDTADAMGSHQPRERKLEILKDTHAGAFAILCCGVYLVVFFAAWCEVDPTGGTLWVLALGPVLSRCLSGIAAASWKNARGTGLLATFTQPMHRIVASVALLTCVVICLQVMVRLDFATGCAVAFAAVIIFIYYRVMSTHQFGGITGDLAGFFLQLCECAMVLAVALTQKGVALL